MSHIIRDKSYYFAVANMIGCVIGLGMFALPYAASRNGLVIFLCLLPVLAFVQYLVHLTYASIIQSLSTTHRLPGCAGHYLGRWAKQTALFLQTTTSYVSLLAYLIVASSFLRLLLVPLIDVPESIWALVLTAIASLILWRGLSGLSRAELFLSFLMLASLALVIYVSFNSTHFDMAYFQRPHGLNIDWIIYGTILFSLNGEAGVPVAVRLCSRSPKQCRSAIFWGGTMIPLTYYLFLVLAVLGIAGQSVSPDALSSLNHYLPGWVYAIALLAGLTAIATTYLSMSANLLDIYQSDYALSRFLSWFLAAWPMFIIYLSFDHSFIRLLGFSGAIMGGITSILILFTYYQASKRTQMMFIVNKGILFILALLFSVGILLSL